MINNPVKLIGVDLDGTLLNDEKQLCPGAEETLDKAAAQGIYIVPITGRPLKGVPSLIRELPSVRYLITSNGAQIYDNQSGENLFSFTIPNEKCKKIMRVLRKADCMFEPFADGVGYAEPYIFDYYLKTFQGGALADYFFSSRVVEEDIEGLFADGSRVADEFFVNCSDVAVRKALTVELDTLGGLQYCVLGGRFLEITAESCDKGAALEAICRYLGIDVKNTLAFGDGENDLTFLEKAGTAAAMENALPSVKEKADMIVNSNNHNGVCETIERFILRDASCGTQS